MNYRVVRDKIIMAQFYLRDDAKAYARDLMRRSGAQCRVWFIDDNTGEAEEQ